MEGVSEGLGAGPSYHSKNSIHDIVVGWLAVRLTQDDYPLTFD